jgi:hypothetical protein
MIRLVLVLVFACGVFAAGTMLASAGASSIHAAHAAYAPE